MTGRSRQLSVAFNPDALALKEGGRVWYTAYPIREDIPGIEVGEFFMHKIAMPGDPVPSREGSTKVVKELNRKTPTQWQKELRAALLEEGDEMTWPALAATVANADPNTAERTNLEAALWRAIESGKLEHDDQFRLRAVTKNPKRKAVSLVVGDQPRKKVKAKPKRQPKTSSKRPSRSYRRPSAASSAEAACVLAAKRWEQSVKRTCGVGASSKAARGAGRVLAERKWTSGADVASGWKAGAPWAANPGSAKYWLNPDGLERIEKPLLDIEEYPYLMEDLRGAFRTDRGDEIYVWGDEDGPFNALIYMPRSGELYHLEDEPEYHKYYDTVIQALGAGMRASAEAEQATWDPRHYPSFEDAIYAFVSVPRNRVEFLRLFWWNDRNGAYDNVLTMEPEEIVELFDMIFGEEVGVSSPRVETYQAIKRRLLRE